MTKGTKGPPRQNPTPKFQRELAERAELLDEADLRVWRRDVRPIVRRVAWAEMERRGLVIEPDRLGI